MAAGTADKDLVENLKPASDDANGPVSTSAEVDENDNGVTEIESLCMNCHDDVRTTDSPVLDHSD
jgi:hypothetical protein